MNIKIKKIGSGSGGKTKVKLEVLLLCMGHNLNKLHAKIQKESANQKILSGFLYI